MSVRTFAHILFVLFAAVFLAEGSAMAGNCSSPTAPEGDMQWFSGTNQIKFCNGTSWVVAGATDTGNPCTIAGKISNRSSEFQYCSGNSGTWFRTNPQVVWGACAAGLTGKFYYDPAVTSYVFCNGTGWARVGP